MEGDDPFLSHFSAHPGPILSKNRPRVADLINKKGLLS